MDKIEYQDTVGLIAGGKHVPGGMTAMRFLFALMATGGTRLR